MEITVINNSLDFDEIETASHLLWSVVPFAKGINLSSILCNLVLYDLDKDKMPERVKIDFIKTTFCKWSLQLDPKVVESSYEKYLKLKRVKHKDKNTLLSISKLKNAFDLLYGDALKYVNKLEKEYKVVELHSLFAEPHEGVIGCYGLLSHAPDEFCAFEVDTVTTTILNGHEIPLFSDVVEKYLDCDDGDGDGGDEDKKIRVLREVFLEFVSPRSFSSSKLNIVRSELSSVYEPLGNMLKTLKTNLTAMKDTAAAKDAGLMYGENIKPLVKKLQDAIVDNIYFQQADNSGEEKKRYTLYFCVCSIEEMLVLFEKAAFVPRVTIDFTREELKEKVDLKRLTVFLYLKVKDYGNNDC